MVLATACKVQPLRPLFALLRALLGTAVTAPPAQPSDTQGVTLALTCFYAAGPVVDFLIGLAPGVDTNLPTL